MRHEWFFLATLLCLTGMIVIAEAGEASQKDIFLRVRRAADAPTFEGAKLLLDQIKADQINDADLASLCSIARGSLTSASRWAFQEMRKSVTSR